MNPNVQCRWPGMGRHLTDGTDYSASAVVRRHDGAFALEVYRVASGGATTLDYISELDRRSAAVCFMIGGDYALAADILEHRA